MAVLTVRCYSLRAEESEDLVIHSGPGLFSHVHDLLIPYATLTTPPAGGVELTSTQAMLHRHRIGLTHDELVTVGRGGTVTKKASSHIFTIELAAPARPPKAARSSQPADQASQPRAAAR